jgi:hypothetical protein
MSVIRLSFATDWSCTLRYKFLSVVRRRKGESLKAYSLKYNGLCNDFLQWRYIWENQVEIPDTTGKF